jgi:hypothetical protein
MTKITTDDGLADFVADRASGKDRWRDLFDALQQVRRDLEPVQWYPLCAGARADCYPTAVTREINGASSVAVLDREHGGEPPLVGLFEAAPRESVGTLAGQKAHYRRWLDRGAR